MLRVVGALMLTRQEIYEACARFSVTLDDGAVTRDTLFAVAAGLESLTYDVAWAIIESKTGSTRASVKHPAQAALAAMDERLIWVQRNRFDGEIPRLRTELEAACECDLNAIDLLGTAAAVAG